MQLLNQNDANPKLGPNLWQPTIAVMQNIQQM